MLLVNTIGYRTMMKICRVCGKEKELSEFYYYNKTDKIHSECKVCSGIASRLWRKNNKIIYNKNSRRWHQENPEATSRYCKRSYKKHFVKRNLEHKEWVIKNREKERVIHNKAITKIRSTIKGRLSNCFRSKISTSLRGNKKGRHWETLVGYTIKQLKSYLEKQFIDGMNWKNYGRFGWHIDHVIPISFFQYNSPEDTEFRMCWRLENLQPLWAKDNLRKNNKIIQVA